MESLLVAELLAADVRFAVVALRNQSDGDAQLAGDVNWVLQNLRWGVAADMERLFGPTVAYPLHRLGSALARGLRSALQGASGLVPRTPPPP